MEGQAGGEEADAKQPKDAVVGFWEARARELGIHDEMHVPGAFLPSQVSRALQLGREMAARAEDKMARRIAERIGARAFAVSVSGGTGDVAVALRLAYEDCHRIAEEAK